MVEKDGQDGSGGKTFPQVVFDVDFGIKNWITKVLGKRRDTRSGGLSGKGSRVVPIKLRIKFSFCFFGRTPCTPLTNDSV